MLNKILALVATMVLLAAPVAARDINEDIWSILDRQCGKAVWLGDGSSSYTTAHSIVTWTGPQIFSHEEIFETYDNLDEWTLTTTTDPDEVAEFCFNPENGQAGTFIVELSYSVTYNATTAVNLALYHSGDGEGFDLGEQIAPSAWHTFTNGFWDVAYVKNVIEMEPTDCIGWVGYPFANGDMWSRAFTVVAEQVYCRDNSQED